MSCHPGGSCCSSCKSSPTSLNGSRAWGSAGEYISVGEGEAEPKETLTQQILGAAGAKLFSLATGAAGAYHGYKRTGSAGWAAGYALLGLFFPIVVAPVMVAQGFGKKK